MIKSTIISGVCLLAFSGLCFGYHRDFVRYLTVTNAMQDQFLVAQNKVRRNVHPIATDMPKLVWSEAMVQKSKEHASRCEAKHTDLPDYSENFSVADVHNARHRDPTLLIQQYADEGANYNYATNSCIDPSKECGHYRQLVSAMSYEVGCAMAECKGIQQRDNSTTPSTLVATCSYHPRGGYTRPDIKPYETGTRSCSNCDHRWAAGSYFDSCEGTLCIHTASGQ